MDEKVILKKIETLQNSSIINQNQANQVVLIFEMLKEFELKKVDVFITHLIMAINRHYQKIFVDSMDLNLINEINQSIYINQCNYILSKILAKLKINFSQSEINFFKLHLLNLFNQ